jgi:3-dehydroquinate synthase
MNTVTVTASRKYDVLIGTELLQDAGPYICKIIQPCKAMIISDSNVWPIYGNIVSKSLQDVGFEPFHYVFTAGESQKNGYTYLEILNTLAEKGFSRSDIIVALGGGVVGDIAGFAAATYMRGIQFVQIPTSLLAMVDSSVGGKTAIDLPSGKNLAGAFCQPSLVLCDIDVLNTLPDDVFTDGCAEVIKYGVLFCPELFSHLEEKGKCFDRQYVITRCVTLKRDVVCRDEFDRGERAKLNLGHTVGHAIEKCSNYAVSHGNAVAAGMAVITKASYANSYCNASVYNRLIKVLSAFGLPTQTSFSAENLTQAALFDKKRNGATISLIIPNEIGQCSIKAICTEEIYDFFKAGL